MHVAVVAKNERMNTKFGALLNQGMKFDVLKFQTLYYLCVSAPTYPYAEASYKAAPTIGEVLIPVLKS
jgi:hypothetical protein